MADKLSDKTREQYTTALTLAHRKWEAEAKPIIERMGNYFRGHQWPTVGPTDQTSGVPRLVANLIFADAKVILPALALRNPRIFVKPTKATTTTPDGQPAILIRGQPIPVVACARAKEVGINWRWRTLRLTQQVRRCLLDALLAPRDALLAHWIVEAIKAILIGIFLIALGTSLPELTFQMRAVAEKHAARAPTWGKTATSQ